MNKIKALTHEKPRGSDNWISGMLMRRCKECPYDDIKVALKVTRLFYMMLLSILLPVKLVYVLPGSH